MSSTDFTCALSVSDMNDDPDLGANYFTNQMRATAVALPPRDSVIEVDIAASLVLLKTKHNLSTNCMGDIIELLKSLNVSNTPSSWYKVKQLLTDSKAISSQYYICSVCNKSMTNKTHCSQCSTDHSSHLQAFHIFSVTDQLQNILINNSNIDLLYQSNSLSMRDIRDGAFFGSIRAQNPDAILTLTMNIDGVQMSKGSQSSIWPILLVVNELPPDVRFDIRNIVLAGVWPGPSKPTRDQIKLLYRPLIDELLRLEGGHSFTLSEDRNAVIQVYLIAACCDKPAQAVVQCIAEPIAAYGCGRCEIEGEVVFFIDCLRCSPEKQSKCKILWIVRTEFSYICSIDSCVCILDSSL